MDKSTQPEALLRIAEIVKPKGPVPCGKSYWWDLVRKGVAPKPVRLGRITAWRRADIAKFLAERFK